MVDSYQDVGRGTGGGYYLIACFFVCACLLFFHVLSLFLTEQNMIVVVSVSLFIICFLCLRSL